MVLRWDFKKHAPADDVSDIENGQLALNDYGEGKESEWIEVDDRQRTCGLYTHRLVGEGCILCRAKKRSEVK
jgi:hypothetical protein